MVSRLRILCLGLGILSTVMACTGTPPAMPPPEAPPAVAPPPTVAPPATPFPSDIPPIVVPSPYIHTPYSTGDRRLDTYQPSPMSVRWMRKNSTTADGAVPRSRNRSSAINNGSRSANASGIRGMNGCGELSPDYACLFVLIVTASLCHQPTIDCHGMSRNE